MRLLTDADGKPSCMRTAQMMTTVVGCVILLSIAFGYASPESSNDALVLIGLGIGGKAVQKAAESKKVA